MFRSSFLSITTLAIASSSFAAPLFIDRTGDISHAYVGGWEHFVGGGVAAFDCDSDQFAELFVAGGAEPAKLLANVTTESGANLAFADATPDNLKIKSVTGAYPIDIDGDSITDLVILRVGQNVIMRGLGGCKFEEFSKLQFSSGEQWTTAFSATWEGNNALPTLAFGNYVDRSAPDGPFEACDANSLYRPVDGAYAEPAKLEPGYCALSLLFSDWGRTSKADLRVSNDRHYYVKAGHEQLWNMRTTPALYTRDQGWIEHKIWGMGIASRDISGDGLPEIYLTSMGDQKLQSIQGSGATPTYTDATFGKGITTHRPYKGDDGRPSTGWHVAFGDIQNDGLDDLFVAKGNVDQMISSAMADPNSLLIQNQDGTFEEYGDKAQVGSEARSRGAALLDLNLNGLLDLVVVNRRANLEIYQNISTDTGNWASIQLTQDRQNANAIGAWIEVKADSKTYARELTIGGGHASGMLAPEHFGLGKTETFEVRITWPNGTKSDWTTLQVNKFWTLKRVGDQVKADAY
ncbi:CRTAC1 family protein [uncultured Maritalea sp.]|jgi:hypothetical protein|uniref:CRTAC1 family protein n=1 Tax=uncultured Maritalea sp. TaxID=757249 RepID=UPI002608E5C9|nr:CRTAC1 family protein [uncultured Maritalea sp.]